LHTINQIIEKSQEYQIEVHLTFIDIGKAFDSVKHDILIRALQMQRLSPLFIRIIGNLYSKIETQVITDCQGEYFKVEKGVKEGDPMPSTLRNSLLEEVFRNLRWEEKGIKVNGYYFNNLRFVDDII